MPKKIAIITGTRAEFGIWTPILHALQHSKKLHLQLIATGMHLQKQFGYTLHDIQNSGIPLAAEVTMYKNGDTPADSLARGTANLAYAFSHLQPDLVMLLGDRLEMLAAANAALACQLPIAHLHGGETAPGQWDEQIRHALTKIAHLHFPATKRAAQRIRQMGEDPKSIHVIGAPALDAALKLTKHLHRSSFIVHRSVLLLHPSSPDRTLEEQRTLLTFKALQRAELPFTAIGPNNDPGHEGILHAYEKTHTPVTMNLTQTDFWQLLHDASLLIGNSSAGILEAASFALPVINLGDRQQGRERNPNVIDVPWSAGTKGIQRAIHHALTDKPFLKKVAKRKNLYGDGHAAEHLLHILESLPFPLATTKRFFNR
jgi:UDP-N-acetylglucosamine 2-epimerase (non-hydrolysing)/GDP/UDP-N,N'-diacetylbacillosamine 2-epimerase (hydrolysing)